MKLHPKQILVTGITAALLLTGCTAAASQHGANPLPAKAEGNSEL